MSITLYDIQSAAHSVEIKSAAGTALALDGSGYVTTNVNGSVTVVDGGGSLTVDGTVAATQSGVWDIGTVTTLTGITNDVNIADGGNSITVDGTVDATQSGVWNIGTVASITADVSIDDGGNSITIDDGGGSITVDGTVTTSPGGFASWLVTAATVATTEGELVSTPLTGRLRILIQNLSNNSIYVKEATGVSSANGMLIARKNVFEADLDDGANIFAIADVGASNDVRIVEFAA